MKSAPKSVGDLPMLQFKRQGDWANWLDKHHPSSSGVWLRLAKKASGDKSVTYAEALEEALRYGWIDGQKKSLDESSWLQKFVPRGAKSIWSKINRQKAEELIRTGRMKPAGLKAVQQAKQNALWEAAYDSQRGAAVPADLEAELVKHSKAKAFFATLNSVNRYAILFRIQTAKKAETRARRIQEFVRMLEKKEKIYP